MEKPCVISVEDDQDLFQLIALSLRSLPIQLYHATTGQEAIEIATRLKPDLIILDINLPDIHGWDVLKTVGSMEKIDLKGVIILTALTGPTHRVIAHLQEVTAYIPKPFKPHELRDIVEKTLELA